MAQVTQPQPGPEAEEVRLGIAIRAYRTMRRMTLRSLAAEAGASPSFISQLEHGRTSVSVGMLRRIAGALGITVADLFAPGASVGHRVVRHADRPELPAGPGTRKYLITPRPLQNLEIYGGEFDPGASTGDEPYAHGDAQEIFMVLRGRIVLCLGPAESAACHELAAGDTSEYRTSTPHRMVNEGSEPAEVLWIISPPTRTGA
ncbi:MAG: helix-turn-helix domain-containing protein [Streptomyces sp.]|uniref:helix-turn-helix domain-containing protein n=1 Tax=Streptomyces sp. TaxID=1931 RepID=UPI003D6AE93E